MNASGILSSAPSPKRPGEGGTLHFPEIMLNIITSSVSDSLAMCPEYKVVILQILKARKAQLRKAGRGFAVLATQMPI